MLTISVHLDFEALLEATRLTLVAATHVDHTRAVLLAHILHVAAVFA